MKQVAILCYHLFIAWPQNPFPLHEKQQVHLGTADVTEIQPLPPPPPLSPSPTYCLYCVKMERTSLARNFHLCLILMPRSVKQSNKQELEWIQKTLVRERTSQIMYLHYFPMLCYLLISQICILVPLEVCKKDQERKWLEVTTPGAQRWKCNTLAYWLDITVVSRVFRLSFCT